MRFHSIDGEYFYVVIAAIHLFDQNVGANVKLNQLIVGTVETF